jgi:hypothetical protein
VALLRPALGQNFARLLVCPSYAQPLGTYLELIEKVACMLRTHEELLLNWFRAKADISSLVVEAFSTSKIRVVTRRWYEFSDL